MTRRTPIWPVADPCSVARIAIVGARWPTWPIRSIMKLKVCVGIIAVWIALCVAIDGLFALVAKLFEQP